MTQRSSMADVRDPQVGDLVDRRYALKREVARGGMGAVFEALQLHTGRNVAVKLLHSGFQFRDDVRQRLLREARALTIVRHPSVVEVLDAGLCDVNGPYVVMEMLEGRTLDGILAAKQKLAVDDAVHLGRQMLEALAFAHARGVVHRDLKPSNVFVARNAIGQEVVKVIDFGIAQVHEDRLEAGAQKLTRAGELLGTLDYMAPEQLLAKDPIDHRCDIYSTAVTIFECLTGEVPYTGTYQAIVVQLLGQKQLPDVCKLRPEVPGQLAKAIERGLAEDPGGRYEDALAFAEELMVAADVGRGRSQLLGAFRAVPGTRPDGPLGVVGEARELHVPTARTTAITPPRGPEPIVAAVEADRGKGKTEPAAAMGWQRRRFPRVPYVTPARISIGDGVADGRIEDISEGGVLAVTDHAVQDGATVHVRFALPITGTIVSLEARSKWVRAARGRGAVGLEFIETPQSVRDVIASYVKLMPPAQG